ncbi:hypothetical protein GGI15_002038 [Coemansia interrupta]|uniref:Uncharacterized protein n=1 Tax=Coemansia interrupta TaxID=1126814 RepID=A0A9W8LLQ3_9FUNG|nr:hypothetical protein GGI15_002038 [Coemansia interrupta]
MDRTTESSRSQRKSKIAASSTTFDDGATDITAANTSGNGGDVDNELDLEDEEGAFDDTKTVVETQLVLLAPDIPNRNVIISAPMSFEALMSSTGSVSTGNCRWGMIGILINFAAAAVSIIYDISDFME